MQRRSGNKATFPGLWTNTCCSHPLATIPDENGTALGEALSGVRRAAQRRLEHELGIAHGSILEQDFCFVARMHYCSASGEGHWGEHESKCPVLDSNKLRSECYHRATAGRKYASAWDPVADHVCFYSRLYPFQRQ